MNAAALRDWHDSNQSSPRSSGTRALTRNEPEVWIGSPPALALGTNGSETGSFARRHAVFVLINLAVAAGFWFRPRWFVAAFALLVVQQIYSHGQRLAAWAQAGRFDGIRCWG